MAKQNVTFIERHGEKFVVGLAGAVLLGAIALYGVSSPNQVEVAGKKVGPKDFYHDLKARAEDARNTMRNRSKLDPAQQVPILVMGNKQQQKLPSGWGIVGIPPNPPVPTAGGGEVRGALALAEILPPKGLTVREGRSQAALPTQQIVEVGPTMGAAANAGLTPVPADYYWALLVAAVDRKAQKAAFAKARYDESYQQLIVARVDVERRELGPDGKWSEPTLVRGYSERVLNGRTEIHPETVADQQVFSEMDHEYVKAYRGLLYLPDAQNEILRPAFQSLLEKPLAWQPPKTLPGYEFKLATWNVLFPVEGESRTTTKLPGGPTGPKPGTVRPGPAGRMDMGVEGRGMPGGRRPVPPTPPGGRPPVPGVLDSETKKRINDLLAQAQKAVNNKEYIKAAELYQQVQNEPGLPEKILKDVEERLASIKADVVKAQNQLAQQQQQNQALGIVQLGEDQEPMWVTDITVQPGKTYMYRVRLVAFNEFAGKLKQLKSASDAEQILIPGKWSDWSEPVTIYPIKQVFFTAVPDGQGGRKAHITAYEWTKGDWHDFTGDVEVGSPVSLTRGRDTFTCGYTVAGIENGRQVRPRVERSGGKVDIQPPVSSNLLMLVSDAGQVEEHLDALDKVRLREHVDRINKEKKLLESEVDQSTGGPVRGGFTPPTIMMRGGERMVPRRGPMDYRRGGGRDREMDAPP